VAEVRTHLYEDRGAINEPGWISRISSAFPEVHRQKKRGISHCRLADSPFALTGPALGRRRGSQIYVWGRPGPRSLRSTTIHLEASNSVCTSSAEGPPARTSRGRTTPPNVFWMAACPSLGEFLAPTTTHAFPPGADKEKKKKKKTDLTRNNAIKIRKSKIP